MKRRQETLEDLQRGIFQKLRETGSGLRGDDEICQRAIDGWPEVKQALHRSERGLYGVCIDCEKTIPLARLKVKPEAIRCIHCQSIYERRSANHGAKVKITYA